MRILRMRLRDYRLFDDVELSFDPGMNLIRGPNESGKSTIVSAIVTALFEKPTAQHAGIRSALRWGVEGGFVIEMEFQNEGKPYRLVKDFAQRKVLLEEVDGDFCVETAKAVQGKLAEMTGFADSAHYMRTACVSHDHMTGLTGDKGGPRMLAAMLREVVVGNRESVLMENAVGELSERIDELKKGLDRPAKYPGTIRRIQDERQVLIERQKGLAESTTVMDRDRERLIEIEGLLGEKEPRLADLEGIIDKNRRLIELEERVAQVSKRFDMADGARESRAGLEKIDREIERHYPRFTDLDPGMESELRKEIDVRKSLESLKQQLVQDLQEEKGSAPAGRPSHERGWIAVVLGIVLLTAGVVLGVLVHPALFSILVLGGGSIAIGAFLLRSAPEAPAGELSKVLEERISRTQQEIDKLGERERDFLDSVNCWDAETFFRTYAAYREMVSERDRLSARLEALAEDGRPDAVDEERRKSSLEVAAVEAELQELEPFRVEPERLEALSRECEDLEREVDGLQKERDGISYHIHHTAEDREEALRIEETLSWLWEEEQRARKQLRVYGYALEAMREARESLLSQAVPVLAESVARTLSKLTGGRYTDVEVREGDLALSVYSEERGTMIPAEELLSTLSRGTVSQLYLAARLELTDILSGDGEPPLIFDDSFSHFDDDRVERLWEILMEVAHDRQVLVFTCTDRYDALAGDTVNVVELSPPG